MNQKGSDVEEMGKKYRSKEGDKCVKRITETKEEGEGLRHERYNYR
jgi:hypothetical protein